MENKNEKLGKETAAAWRQIDCANYDEWDARVLSTMNRLESERDELAGYICRIKLPLPEKLAEACGECGSGADWTPKVEKLVRAWRDMPAAEMRLRCGEMTAQEIRTVRAVLNQIIPPNAEVSRGDDATPTTLKPQITIRRYDDMTNDPSNPEYNAKARDAIMDLCPFYDPNHKCGIVRENVFKDCLSELRERERLALESVRRLDALSSGGMAKILELERRLSEWEANRVGAKRSESQREAAGLADEKPDGRAENV
jgi:hypothetical protein